jgi:hypothetical protein
MHLFKVFKADSFVIGILGVCSFAGLLRAADTTSPGNSAGAVGQPLPSLAEDPNRPPGLTQRPGNTNNWYDAAGNLYVRAATGRWSNYDEAKAGGYTLPDPLLLTSGRRVNDVRTWFKKRRPEILNAYSSEIFGRIPKNTPKVRFEVTATDTNALNGAAVMKSVTGHIGKGRNPNISFTLYTPANAKGRAPIILVVGPGPFAFGPAGGFGGTNRPAGVGGAAPTNRAAGFGGFRFGGAPLADIIARGWGLADVGVNSIQADRNNFTNGVIGMTLAPGQSRPAADEWGVISAWAWGLSRVMDYLETDRSVDVRQVAIQGHSRWGKTALWAAALDPRFAMVYASCSGEMGASLSRRDWGETVDNMAGEYLGYQFAWNFRKYAGHWNDLPVDAHELIALIAPRPVFVTGGSTDQWSDPHGEFLAEVAAGPVYRLLGKMDLGTTHRPGLDVVVDSGELAFTEHTGGHLATPADWQAFLKFAERHFKVPH